MFDWDDLRIFLAAARGGSFAAAGSRLGIDPATVGRRIARLESALRATLFVRSKAGLQLTAAGAQVMASASQAEAIMETTAATGHQDRTSGTVRLSVAEGFGTIVLAPALASLRGQHPNLKVELAANSGLLSPSRREVDMAITLAATGSTRLLAEPLAQYQLALYAAPEYLQQRGVPTTVGDLPEHEIVGYIDDLIYAPELRYLNEILPGLSPILASSSIRAQREILLGGGGIGVLPCFMSDGLVQVLDTVVIERRFWLTTHPDFHGTARMKAVRDWLHAICAANTIRLSPFPRSK